MIPHFNLICQISVVGQFEIEKILLSVKAIISSIAQAWSVIPAAIAGITQNGLMFQQLFTLSNSMI